MSPPEWLRFVVGIGVLVLVAGYVALRFEVTTDLDHFLPQAADREVAALSRQIADSELSRTMILAIEAPDRDAAAAASRSFEAALRRDERTASAIGFLEGGPRAGIERVLFDLYEPRRDAFLAPSPSRARERIAEEGVRHALRELRRELRGPLSTLVSRVAPRDPFLTIPKLLDRLERSRANELVVVDGRFLTRDGRSAILFLGTKASALDARAQAPLLEGIDSVWAEVAADLPFPARLDQSGVNRFAVRTAQAIEGDIQRVSLLSSLLIGGFLLIYFRSLRLLLLAAIPVGAGVVTGAASVLAVFGKLHGITLAFGASLIGVSIDYVVHLYCHRAVVRPPGGARASIRSILRPLATGALTTVAGFAALAASALVGLREVALFSVSGIAAAFVATVVFVPALMGDRVAEVEARERMVARLTGFLDALRRRRAILGLVLFAVAFVAVLVLPRARWNPDITSMAQMDPALVAEDDRVRARVAPVEQMRFVVALGADDASALETNDRVSASLAEAVEAGAIVAARNIAALLPSPAHQLAVARIPREDPDLPARLRRIAAEEGFSPTAFDAYANALSTPPPAPLTYADLAQSPLAGLVRTFRVTLGDRVGFVTFLQGVKDVEAIAARIDAIPDAVFLQQADLFEEAQLAYQRRTLELLAWGLLGVLAFLALRYREPRRTAVAFLPSVLASALTVSVLTAVGHGLDLISLTALLFVVSMGVDYSVFLVDAHDEASPRSTAAALMGALLAGFSTVVAFGLLALSRHPVLASLGLTAAVGIATSLLLAPTALVLLRGESGDTRGVDD